MAERYGAAALQVRMPATDSTPIPGEPSGQEARHRSLPLLLAAATLVLGLLFTFGVWRYVQMSSHDALLAEYDLQVDDKLTRIQRRMGTYEQILRSTRAMLDGNVRLSQDAFRRYVDELGLEDRYPGIQAVAIAELLSPAGRAAREAELRDAGHPEFQVWPPGERDTVTAITNIAPFDAMNRRAFGFDMYSEPTRRAAMARARDTGQAALSGKVTLVQEAGADVQAGALMYLPVYRRGLPSATPEQRRTALAGWVYAPFRLGDFMRGLLNERASGLEVDIFDGVAMSRGSCLYGCERLGEAPAGVLPERVIGIDIAGRPWTLRFRATPAFEQRAGSEAHWMMLAAGIPTSMLLALLVWTQASGRHRALALALQMTREVRSSHHRAAAEQRRLRVILDNSYDAFVATDASGLVTDWNRQAECIFGWTEQQAVGAQLARLVMPRAGRDGFHRGLLAFMADNGMAAAQRTEWLAKRRDGTPVAVEIAMVALRHEESPTANLFIRDLSEQKAAEARETERQAALERTRQALHGAQRLEAVGKLTGGVAHDFNNVLQIISGNIQLLMMGNLPDDARQRRLQSILDAVDRGTKLSSQLLAFARRQPLQPLPVDLRALLANIDDLLQRALGSDVRLAIAAAEGLWPAQVDPSQLENVILNLAINARDAMEGHGTLTIALTNAELDAAAAARMHDLRPGRYVHIEVADTGAGMTQDVLANAFEPFFTTKPAGQGTGLGLSMAYGFVKQSGGHIEIDSTPGHGTAVHVYLPRAEAAPVSGTAPAAGHMAGGGRETVLVVDDDDAVREAAVEMLRGLGYTVLQAHDGESALHVLRGDEAIDLLFTDVVMPGPVGSMDMARIGRSVQPGMEVLFTSGYTRTAMMREGRLEEGVELLRKPYRREQLAARVRELLDRRLARVPPAWRVQRES